MRMKIPSTVKGWAREVKYALDEALTTQESSIGTSKEVSLVNLYRMAPAIAAIYRSIDDEQTKEQLIRISWPTVRYVHENIPEYKEKYRRCFAHAYLDSMVYLQHISRKEAENVIDFLEHRGQIEAWPS